MPLVIPHARRRARAAETWADPRSFATTLLSLFHDEYYDPADPPAGNCYTWHPGTIALEVRDDFRVELPRANFDRLMAGIRLATSDGFYKDPGEFVMLCNVLSGDLFDPATWDPADALECAWGITEGMLLGPPDDADEEPFAPEVLAYIGRALADEGILDPPDVLRIAIRAGGLPGRAAVGAAHADDPATLAAIHETEVRKTQEINQRIRDGLRELIDQLSALDLRHGDAGALAGKLAQELGRD